MTHHICFASVATLVPPSLSLPPCSLAYLCPDKSFTFHVNLWPDLPSKRMCVSDPLLPVLEMRIYSPALLPRPKSPASFMLLVVIMPEFLFKSVAECSTSFWSTKVLELIVKTHMLTDFLTESQLFLLICAINVTPAPIVAVHNLKKLKKMRCPVCYRIALNGIDVWGTAATRSNIYIEVLHEYRRSLNMPSLVHCQCGCSRVGLRWSNHQSPLEGGKDQQDAASKSFYR